MQIYDLKLNNYDTTNMVIASDRCYSGIVLNVRTIPLKNYIVVQYKDDRGVIKEVPIYQPRLKKEELFSLVGRPIITGTYVLFPSDCLNESKQNQAPQVD